nr:MAG TPA_asm: hypothetical protein [Caudoviricetes sp.]
MCRFVIFFLYHEGYYPSYFHIKYKNYALNHLVCFDKKSQNNH